MPSLTIHTSLAQRNAYMIAAGVIGGLYILCAVILSVGVREKRGEASDMMGYYGVMENLCILQGAPQEPSWALGHSFVVFVVRQL